MPLHAGVLGRRQVVGQNPSHQGGWVLFEDHKVSHPLLDEARGYRCVNEDAQRLVVAFDVQATDGLLVDPQSRPCDHFKQLLERPKATRHGNEGIASLGHQCLSSVHVLDFNNFSNAAKRKH